MSNRQRFADAHLTGEELLPGRNFSASADNPGSVFRPLIDWFDNNLWFRRSKSVPGVSFRYTHVSTHLGGAAAFNTAGLALVQTFTPANGYLQFTDPSILTRLDLTISVRGNSNNALIGAYVLLNGPAAGASFNPAGHTNIVLQNTTNNEVAVISKHFAWSPYSGMQVSANAALSIAVIGDNTGICGVTATYHWLANPGDIALGRHQG